MLLRYIGKMKFVKLILAILSINIMVGLISSAEENENSQVFSNTDSIDVINNQIPLDVNKDSIIDYIINLKPADSDAVLSYTSKSSEKYKYMESSAFEFIIIKSNQVIGKYTLTLNCIEDSIVYYSTYTNKKDKCNIIFEIAAVDMHPNVDFYSVKSNGYSKITNCITSFNNNNSYFEGTNKYLKFGKAIAAKPLGSSVYEITEPTVTQKVLEQNSNLVFSFNFCSKANTEIRHYGILSTKQLVNWNNELAVRTAMLFDTIELKTFFNDGMYDKNLYNYVPRSVKGKSIFKNPSALIIRSCSYTLNEGQMFKVMGINLMYQYLNSFNDKGYIPTMTYSEWLKGDYGITNNYCDTRWNSDTMDSLMAFYEKYPDEYTMEKINKYIAFYKNFYKRNSFKYKTSTFVPDYISYDGKGKKTHCSLNHYLAEMQVLFRYWHLTGDKQSLDIANAILKSITSTYRQWIKPNNDLWYSVSPKGVFGGKDYPTLTYSDLLVTIAMLKEYKLPIPNEISELIKSKNAWARSNRYIK